MLPWLLITTCRFFEISHDVEPFSTPLLLIKPKLSHQLTKSLPSLSRSVCTWRPGRSASTSGTAHLRTAPKKETFGSTWRRTTVGFSIFIWIHLWCFEACVITLPVVPPSSLPPSLLTLCSCRLGAALWAVAAVSEAGLGWRDGQQRRAGERQTDPHAHRLRWGSGESIFSVSLLFLVILLMCAVVGDKN